jgi:hypothetical protein
MQGLSGPRKKWNWYIVIFTAKPDLILGVEKWTPLEKVMNKKRGRI